MCDEKDIPILKIKIAIPILQYSISLAGLLYHGTRLLSIFFYVFFSRIRGKCSAWQFALSGRSPTHYTQKNDAQKPSSRREPFVSFHRQKNTTKEKFLVVFVFSSINMHSRGWIFYLLYLCLENLSFTKMIEQGISTAAIMIAIINSRLCRYFDTLSIPARIGFCS